MNTEMLNLRADIVKAGFEHEAETRLLEALDAWEENHDPLILLRNILERLRAIAIPLAKLIQERADANPNPQGLLTKVIQDYENLTGAPLDKA